MSVAATKGMAAMNNLLFCRTATRIILTSKIAMDRSLITVQLSSSMKNSANCQKNTQTAHMPPTILIHFFLFAGKIFISPHRIITTEEMAASIREFWSSPLRLHFMNPTMIKTA